MLLTLNVNSILKYIIKKIHYLFYLLIFLIFYHYMKLTKVREQNGTRVVLAKPGEVPSGQDSSLKWAWQEIVADSIRYSDW